MKNTPELQAENAKLKFLLDLAEESLMVSSEALSIAKNTCAGNSANFTTAIASVMDTMKKINHHNAQGEARRESASPRQETSSPLPRPSC